MTSFAVIALVVVMAMLHHQRVQAILALPDTPPLGWNSFDIQHAGEAWNETVFRAQATAMAEQLLPHGFNIITIDGGWSGGLLDDYGRPIPDPKKWPSSAGGKGFGPLASWTHSLGLKFGLWRIRGVEYPAIKNKLPIKGTSYTADQIVLADGKCSTDDPFPLDIWCQCTWSQTMHGVNVSHPAAQAYYNSIVDLMVEWDTDFIKYDCLYDGTAGAMAPTGYSAEEVLVMKAVEQSPKTLTLSLSPGGGMTAASAKWIAQGKRASMYRATNDFHSATPDGIVNELGQHVFVVGNISQYIGVNNTWPDLDMMDLGSNSKYYKTPAAKLHAAIWIMARSPLMFAGVLPTDDDTLNLVTNKLALQINQHSSNLRVQYEGNCTCSGRPNAAHECTPLWAGPGGCVAVWFADMPTAGCKAVGVFNVGGSASTTTVDTRAHFSQSDVASSVVNVYSGDDVPVDAEGKFRAPLPASGGDLFMVKSAGVASCI